MRERRFGVEIELGMPYGVGPSQTKALIKETPGLEHWAEGYIHSDGTGVEIPSPILQGRKGLNELRMMMKLLTDNGGYVTGQDGLHVHHDAPDYLNNGDAVERLIETWSENQTNVDLLVHASRVNHWACSRNWHKSSVENFKRQRAHNNRSRGFGYWGRGALNIDSLNEHGSIEFRQHEGTLDFATAAAWIRFGQAFLDSVIARKRVLTCKTPDELLKRIRTAKGASTLLLTKNRTALLEDAEYDSADDYDSDGDDYCCEECDGSRW